jgi:hypothetical protein
VCVCVCACVFVCVFVCDVDVGTTVIRMCTCSS